MYKQFFNKRCSLKFKHFSNKGYALFSVLGREVLVGTLSIATLSHAKAEGVSTVQTANVDSALYNNGREVSLDEVSVTASRAPLTQSQQARMVTVLSKADIAAAPVQSINDLLKYAVGVDVRQRGPLGTQTDVSIRGSNSEQITILLNGINICDPQTAHNAFDFPVDISEIERIEVLEGPAGRIYGTSSLLGAINIVTRIPKQSGASAHVEAGSYGYLNVGARTYYSREHWAHSVSGSYARSDGYSRNKAGSLNADYRGGKAFYQGRYDDNSVTVNWHAGLSTKNVGSNTFYSPKSDDQFEHTFKTYTAVQALTKQGRLHFRPSIYWNRNMDRFEFFRGKLDKVPFNYHRTDIYGVNLNSYFDWSLGRTAFGAELRNEDLVSGNLGEPLNTPRHIHGTDRDYTLGLNRTNISLNLEHNLILQRFTLSAGLVAVKNSWAEMNMRVYPGIDAGYRIGNNWKVYASYNTSLRMPSVTELYLKKDGYFADKHLKPEELSALEAGVKFRSNAISASASIYHNHYKNLIDWIRDTRQADNVWKSVNFGRINALGIETNVDMSLAHLLPSQRILERLSVAYSYINQDRHEADGIQSQYALEYLRHKLVANLRTHLWRNLHLALNYRLQKRTGSYTNSDGAVCRYATFGLLDTRLSWDAKHYQAYIVGNNLLNKKYVDYGIVPQPGTWLVAGFSIKM